MKDSKDTVQSVDRALTILEELSDYEDGLGITEISRNINLHKTTVFRLMGTLIEKGYVEQDAETNKYKITLKLFELGSKKLEKMDILTIARPHLKRLVRETSEVVHLVILDGTDIVYIDKVESESTIRMHSRIGKRAPAYCTAVGKAMLAHHSDNDVERIWKNSRILKYTENTITNFDEFKEELRIIKERGYSIDNEENELGVRCVGAPIFNHKREVNFAISVSGPIMRITDDKVEEIAQKVMECSSNISKELGYVSR